MKIMQEQAEFMAALIENLLSLSKIELNHDQRPDETVDVLEIAEDVAASLSQKPPNAK